MGKKRLLSKEMEPEILKGMVDGSLWTIERFKSFANEKYDLNLSDTTVHNYLDSLGLTLDNYCFPKICDSEVIKSWFESKNRYWDIRNNLYLRYGIYWIGTKKLRGKFNMLYLVSMQRKLYWRIIDGNITERRQRMMMYEFTPFLKEELGEKLLVLFRTNENIYAFNVKKFSKNIFRIYPSHNEMCAATTVTATTQSKS